MSYKILDKTPYELYLNDIVMLTEYSIPKDLKSINGFNFTIRGVIVS